MHTNSDMQVRWKSKLSNVFPLMNGVKQGGCLSPMLFTLYLDGLIQKLKHSGIGCHIGRTTVESLDMLMTGLLYHLLFLV